MKASQEKDDSDPQVLAYGSLEKILHISVGFWQELNSIQMEAEEHSEKKMGF